LRKRLEKQIVIYVPVGKWNFFLPPEAKPRVGGNHYHPRPKVEGGNGIWPPRQSRGGKINSISPQARNDFFLPRGPFRGSNSNNNKNNNNNNGDKSVSQSTTKK